MHAAQAAGRFRHIGISNFEADEVERLVKVCFKNSWALLSVYQGHYNALARRSEEELLPVLRKYRIAFYAYRYVFFAPG